MSESLPATEEITGEVQTTPYVVTQSAFMGYDNRPTGASWHSDAGTLLTMVGQTGGVTPTELTIWANTSPNSAIGQIQMEATPLNGNPQPLTKYGTSGGTQHTLIQGQIEEITAIEFFGTAKAGDTKRVGQIVITFARIPPQTFGTANDLGSLGKISPPPGTALLGFTGDSGSQVDGLALLFGASAT